MVIFCTGPDWYWFVSLDCYDSVLMFMDGDCFVLDLTGVLICLSWLLWISSGVPGWWLFCTGPDWYWFVSLDCYDLVLMFLDGDCFVLDLTGIDLFLLIVMVLICLSWLLWFSFGVPGWWLFCTGPDWYWFVSLDCYGIDLSLLIAMI